MPTPTTAIPVNLKKQDNSPAAIARAVDYAVAVAEGYLSHWRVYGRGASTPSDRPLEGLRVLELGPGATLGIPVLLACAGARMAISDRYPAYWDADFHRPFFEALLRRESERGPRFTAPLRELLSADTFVPEVLESFDGGAEQLGLISARFDLVLSNAVLEHVEDLEITAANLARLTAPRGWGFHQVDFRDHRNFDRPLEYLTMPADDFATMRRESFCECGCRWRAGDVAAAFEASGFTVGTHVNLRTTPEYLAAVRPRLQPEFASLSDEELLTTSALFVMERRGDDLRPAGSRL
jgi:hypothetical protein